MNRVIRNIIPALTLLAVVPAFAHAAAAPQGTVEKTKGAIVKGFNVTVDKTKEGVSKTGEVTTDAYITTRIREQFVGDDLLKGSDIDVDTAKHVVTLTGTVTGRAGRTRASLVASRTEGVNSVVNRLTIGPKREHAK